MTQKQIQIIIILSILVVAIFVMLGFFGLGGFPTPSAPEDSSSASEIIKELQTTGTVSELKVEQLFPGEGEPAKAGDTIVVNYTGVLPDGTVFDASQNHGEPFSFTLGVGAVIQGWDQGLMGMRKGERRLLAIPSSLAYGPNAVGSIPPNSTLVFEVELLEIKPSKGAQIAQ